MKYLIANVDPQLHPLDENAQKICSAIDARIEARDCVTEADVIRFAKDADAVLCARAPVTRKVIDELVHCKVIGRFGAGTDNVDHDAATQRSIVVVYVPDFCTEEVANHALLLILACHKKLGQLDKFVRAGGWGFSLLPPMPALSRQTLGLVGFGRIAQALGRKARNLGLTVSAYDPYVEKQVYPDNDVQAMSLHDVLSQSDYVSLHVPLNAKTEKMMGAAQLRLMKPTAWLINCARGAVVDEEALIASLKQKTIAGAALDCLTCEPPAKDNPLFGMDNVLLTPHSAAYSDDAIGYLREKTVRQVIEVLTGGRPEFIRNPEVWDKTGRNH